MIGWGPAEFRAATIRDLADAIEGYREKNGLKKVKNPMTRGRLDELKRLYG